MTISIKKSIYIVETVLVVIPAILFLVFSFPWLLAALSLKAWTPSFILFLLWLGGWLGIGALIQMLVRIFTNQKTEINYLWLKSLAGSISAIAPILFSYSTPPDGGNSNAILLLLCPIVVGIHWLWAFENINLKPVI